jgi:uncharacterized peroxidase-related enzyme
MNKLKMIDSEKADGKGKIILGVAKERYGMIPNILRTMANSPAVLEAYLTMVDALDEGLLPVKLREQIAIVISEKNDCDYCLAYHSAVGQLEGLSREEVDDSRKGVSPDSKVEAALQFAVQVVENRGKVTDDAVGSLYKTGYSDGEIAEIVANVALTMFSNYFNLVAGTPTDFPEVPDREFS